MNTLRIARVLFPTDFSECAEHAFSHAAFIAVQHGAELHVLHVAEATDADPLVGLGGLRITPEDVAEQLGLPAPPPAPVAPDDPIPLIEAEVRAPSVAPAILDYVRTHDIDLIVMGTHGRQGFERVRLGSVAEAVVRQAPCPVLLVGAVAPAGLPAIERVLAPTDFSDPAQEAARYARAIADLYGARLDLVHVLDEMMLRPAYVPLLGSFQIEEARARGQAEAELARLSAELGGEAATHVLVGHPATTLVDVAEEHGSDLIVIGSHGRRGFERLLLGSVAEQVIRLASCPVFVVKTFGRSLLAPAPAEHAEAAA